MEEIIGKEFLQHCGDTLRVLEKTNQKVNNMFLYRCIFLSDKSEKLALKWNIQRGTVGNSNLNSIVNKIFKQKNGGILFVKKQIGKIGNKAGQYECEITIDVFGEKKSYIIFSNKDSIVKGIVSVEKILHQEFLNKKEWVQKCGDILVVDEQIDNRLYKCHFKNFYCELTVSKKQILLGNIENPEIFKQNFINKEWKQKDGDILAIIKKGPKRGYWIVKSLLYNNEFIANKREIENGNIQNIEIIKLHYLGKEFKQNCGDILIIEEILSIGHWKCKFKSDGTYIFSNKYDIEHGLINNPNFINTEEFPWKSKESLEKYIIKNFSQKVSLEDLSKSLKISACLVGQKINEYKLRNYIKYWENNKENEVFQYLKQVYNDEEILQNNSTILNGKEIDFYISNLKLGFEFNGNYWHSELYKERNYHQEKSLLAQEKKINLVHIWEWEWNIKQEIIKSLIKSKLGIFEKKIGARQCQIKKLDYKTYASFCNENHLQGACAARIKLGLFYKDELIQVISFGSPRFSLQYEWEIIRECSKLGYCIIGGKEKLWKYFVKNYHPNSVISYCDFSKFNGNSYLKLGFKKERLNKPGFWWVDDHFKTIYLRTPWKHQEMKERGYYKIYDAGQLVFTFNK
jgi:hypothetical protein